MHPGAWLYPGCIWFVVLMNWNCRLSFFQCQPNQPICLICHEQRNVQHIIIQFQIVQWKSYTEFDLIREQFFGLFKAFTGNISLRLDLRGEISFSRGIRESTSWGGFLYVQYRGSTSNCVIKVCNTKFSVNAPLNSVNRRLPSPNAVEANWANRRGSPTSTR